ncbi:MULTISPECIES: hypothetical protein [unclassified Streptomyces]|uniref:hypothetical protein n=1 Tax=unclassified Streptomyces TaxID=2593676 RepID=UPI003D8C1446
MSTLALLIVLLLVLVGLLIYGGLAYLVRQHPTWGAPIGVALADVTLMATLVATIVTR